MNSLRVAEARHTQTETTSGLILLCMVLLEPGYRVYVYSQNEDNKLQTLDKKGSVEKASVYLSTTYAFNTSPDLALKYIQYVFQGQIFIGFSCNWCPSKVYF